MQQLEEHGLQQRTPTAVAARLTYHLQFVCHNEADVVLSAVCDSVRDERSGFLVPVGAIGDCGQSDDRRNSRANAERRTRRQLGKGRQRIMRLHPQTSGRYHCLVCLQLLVHT